MKKRKRGRKDSYTPEQIKFIQDWLEEHQGRAPDKGELEKILALPLFQDRTFASVQGKFYRERHLRILRNAVARDDERDQVKFRKPIYPQIFAISNDLVQIASRLQALARELECLEDWVKETLIIKEAFVRTDKNGLVISVDRE